MNILPYLGILVAAAVEGEVVYSGAVVMVFLGRLNPFGVLISGSIGGLGGVQVFFFPARGKIWRKPYPLCKNCPRGGAVQERKERPPLKPHPCGSFFSC